MNAIFIIRDFLFTRDGKILLLCVAIIIATFYASKHGKKAKAESASLPAPPQSVWDHDDKPIQQTEKNLSFELFVPAARKPEKAITKEATPRKVPPILSPLINPTAAPLFKEQRKPSSQSPSPTPADLPPLEEGAIIFCKLISPVTTGSNNAPVTARITRSVIRDGVTLLPKGSRVYGEVSSTKNERVFFDQSWRIATHSGQTLPLTAHLQERGFDHRTSRLTSSDGRTGLAGRVVNPPEKERPRAQLLNIFAKGAARLGKETVRTSIGDYVPATGRNVLIEGGATTIDLLTNRKSDSSRPKPYVYVPAGTEFYLTVGVEQQGRSARNSPSIDLLLEEAALKRLLK